LIEIETVVFVRALFAMFPARWLVLRLASLLGLLVPWLSALTRAI